MDWGELSKTGLSDEASWVGLKKRKLRLRGEWCNLGLRWDLSKVGLKRGWESLDWEENSATCDYDEIWARLDKEENLAVMNYEENWAKFRSRAKDVLKSQYHDLN